MAGAFFLPEAKLSTSPGRDQWVPLRDNGVLRFHIGELFGHFADAHSKSRARDIMRNLGIPV